MLFNSLEFLLFLPTIFLLYWFVFRQLKHQNILLFVSSYIFYGWWDWRFLSLILFSTLIDFFIGYRLNLSTHRNKRKFLLYTSLFVNLGLLVFFKYFNFFIESWIEAWADLGIQMHQTTLNIILPVGISFYTFQTLSYTIDVYQRKIEPVTNFMAFASYVAFFPQLVAGPIERASNLLPQFYKKRIFNYEFAVSGMKLILWGLLKKVVIADSCAVLVNDIFQNYQNESGLTLCMGIVYFSFQIYGDFSGYSDIAIGTSRLFGFNLMRNFDYPYFSRDIAEFWRRWHISLSTWFRDYLYFPLGGSKGSLGNQLRNVFIIFLVSGIWHGANWTYVAWGGINALFFLPIFLLKKNRKHTNAIEGNLPSLSEFLGIMKTYMLVTFSWIFFRSESIKDAVRYIERIIDFNTFIPNTIRHKKIIPFLLIFVFFEWISRKQEYAIVLDKKYRIVFYLSFAFLILYYASVEEKTTFIYFQF
ncbi:MBOAT family O-acyltransferase [Flavicella marina]|uniref:MBOAT family O-acyltransferase n=1 Tax=Flavicella marina TaxID=1475951 RepID=UPI0012658902|nr:MBOAT family O-acyltransferase [Flavicella marina]